MSHCPFCWVEKDWRGKVDPFLRLDPDGEAARQASLRSDWPSPTPVMSKAELRAFPTTRHGWHDLGATLLNVVWMVVISWWLLKRAMVALKHQPDWPTYDSPCPELVETVTAFAEEVDGL